MNNQELAALCRIEIRRWQSVPDKQYMVALMEAALAALTAEPVAYYWFNESDYGRDVSMTSPEEDDDAADALENGWQVEPLIRIPKLTGGDEC